MSAAEIVAWAVLAVVAIGEGFVFVVTREVRAMSQAFDRLAAECASCVTLMGQAVTTINALAARVASAPDAANVVDPAAVDAVTASLQAAASSLSSAVAAQTPPAPTA